MRVVIRKLGGIDVASFLFTPVPLCGQRHRGTSLGPKDHSLKSRPWFDETGVRGCHFCLTMERN